MKALAQIAIGSALLLIGAVVNQFVVNYNDRVRFLERRVEISEGILSRTPISEANFSIKHKEKILNDISIVSVKLYNFSDQDYEDIPVFVDLKPVRGLSMNILAKYASGAKGLPVTEIDIEDSKENVDIARYGYLLKAANRLESDEVFSASFIIAGNVAPTLSVEIQKKGLENREFSKTNVSALSPIQILILILSGVVLLVVYVMFLIFIEKQWKKREPKIDEEIVKGILSSKQFKDIVGKFTSNENAKIAVTNIVSESRKRNRWINIPKFLRKYYTNLDPDRPQSCE